MRAPSLAQRLGAEGLGTAALLMAVIGSGIMGERLAAGHEALALLANTLATGATLFVLVTMLGPVSGAHINPAVTMVMFLQRELSLRDSSAYVAVQILGAFAGVLAAHAMFDLPLFQVADTPRNGTGQGLAETIATFGLLATILLTRKANPGALAASVALYIAAAYWFTASTAFANPAATIARGVSDTFAGIRPADSPAFIAAQLLGALGALWICRGLTGEPARPADHAQP